MLVLTLHTAYLCALFTGALTVNQQMYLALAAYASYAINATQFLLKLRAARLQSADQRVSRIASPRADQPLAISAVRALAE
jgi:3-vinyl bacteriochlorophyllide hydratase